MESEITRLVHQYESGKLTRRQLVTGLGSLVAICAGAGRILAQDVEKKPAVQVPEKPASTFEGIGLNHIALRVTDIGRSRDFYIEHLGLKVSRQGRNNCFLTCGKNFVALFRNKKPGMDHYCYSIKNYDVKQAEKKLKAEGFKPRVTGRRIYFKDPDGLTVQLASKSHRA